MEAGLQAMASVAWAMAAPVVEAPKAAQDGMEVLEVVALWVAAVQATSWVASGEAAPGAKVVMAVGRRAMETLVTAAWEAVLQVMDIMASAVPVRVMVGAAATMAASAAGYKQAPRQYS